MTLPTALAVSCDTCFYQLGYDFYKLPPSQGHPLQAWAARFGFGRKTGVDVGPESSGLLPTPEWRKRTFTRKTDPGNWQIDRVWKPGDSIQLAIGQKDLLVTPLQMARFYALIANGGKLVHAAPAPGRRSRAAANPRSPARVVHSFTPPAAAAGRPRPDYLQVGPGRPLPGDALARSGPRTASSATSRSRSPARPARREKDRPEHRPERPVVVVRLRPGGRLGAPGARRLRADRERRLRRRRGRPRGAAGLRGVLPRQAAARGRLPPMIEAVNTRARGLRPHRGEAVGVASALRRLDWWLLGAMVALLAYGLWAIAGITAHDVQGNATTTSSARGSTQRSAASASSRCCSSTRRSIGATSAGSTAARPA